MSNSQLIENMQMFRRRYHNKFKNAEEFWNQFFIELGIQLTKKDSDLLDLYNSFDSYVRKEEKPKGDTSNSGGNIPHDPLMRNNPVDFWKVVTVSMHD